MQKSSTKFLQIESNNTLKRSCTIIKWGLYQEFNDSSIYTNQCDTPINKLKDKNHIIISIDVEKMFNNIWQQSVIKTLQKVGMEGNYLKIIKTIYVWQTHCKHYSQQWRTESISLKEQDKGSGTRQGCPLSPLLFTIKSFLMRKDISHED